MNKTDIILKYFQKKDQLTVKNKDYQKTVSSLFTWLIENDHITNDITSKLFPNDISTAVIIAKENGIAAGLEEISYLMKKYTRLTFKPFIKDGSKIKNQEVIAQLEGKSHEILAYERTILNILQRMSGIATETNRLITLIKSKTSPPSPLLVGEGKGEVYLAATRKTPWMSLDKKAVAVGGGLTHRLNLSDGILIKDNHLKIISNATKTPRGWQAELIEALTPPMVKEARGLIEIEVETEKQANQVLKTFQQLTTHNSQLITHNHLALLLDNFTPSQAKTLLRDLNDLYDLSGIIFEASGGIDKNNILEWSKTGVDILSLGSLTHSPQAVNLSLEFS
ncbi:hypothetical protein HY945_00405 [Candidatus Gottesmanbacteria bacterium]|nr:hypothetical protein [Candidatus Gottesmanbacteria bacterium]